MNPFERHGIKHLSPSSLRLYREEPAAWVVKYLLRVKDESGPGAWRGTAVEAGLDRLLFGYDLEMAEAETKAKFEELAQGLADAKTDGERRDLTAYLREAQKALEKAGTPLTRQSKVSYSLPGIEVPIIGYADYVWPDYGLDLKTTQRMPSAPRPEHVEQVALYAHELERPFSLLYVTPRKHAIYPVDSFMVTDALERLHRGARAVRALLAKCDSARDALPMFSPDFSTYQWSPEMVQAARQIYDGAMA